MTKVKNHHSQKADDGKSLRLAGQWGVIGVGFGVAPTHLQLYFLSQRKHHGIMSWHNGMWQCLHETDWVQFSHSVESDSATPWITARQASLSITNSRACSNSCPSSRWCHPTVVPFSSCFQSFPASGSFQMSQFFTSGGQSTGISLSASVLPMNIQDWFPLVLTGWISFQSKGLSRVFNTMVQKHQFCAQLSL